MDIIILFLDMSVCEENKREVAHSCLLVKTLSLRQLLSWLGSGGVHA